MSNFNKITCIVVDLKHTDTESHTIFVQSFIIKNTVQRTRHKHVMLDTFSVRFLILTSWETFIPAEFAFIISYTPQRWRLEYPEKGDKGMINTSLWIPSEVDINGSGAKVNNRMFLPATNADTDVASADIITVRIWSQTSPTENSSSRPHKYGGRTCNLECRF